jgi:hypothetical protein
MNRKTNPIPNPNKDNILKKCIVKYLLKAENNSIINFNKKLPIVY